MILTEQESLLVIALIAVATFLTRVLPFLLFPHNRKTPVYIIYLGDVLPYALIGMLVIYCLKEVKIIVFPYGLPEGIAVLAVVLLHLWQRNTLLSIGGGTVLYMLLVQQVFR